MSDGVERAKETAALSAASHVYDGDVVGLGTGSTAALVIERLGARVDNGLDIVGIPTSLQSRQLALSAGIPLTMLSEETPTVAIDGADQVVGRTLIKGGGAAHTREKVVATAADRFMVVCDESKRSDALDHPLPVEVLPHAHSTVTEAIAGLGGDATPRMNSSGCLLFTEQGNIILDCDFGRIEDPDMVGPTINSIPGVVEHGLFYEMADEIHWGREEYGRIDRF